MCFFHSRKSLSSLSPYFQLLSVKKENLNSEFLLLTVQAQCHKRAHHRGTVHLSIFWPFGKISAFQRWWIIHLDNPLVGAAANSHIVEAVCWDHKEEPPSHPAPPGMILYIIAVGINPSASSLTAKERVNAADPQ